MKKIITIIGIALLALNMRAQAQATGVTVVNNTSCEVFYQIFGDVAPGCGSGLISSFISLPAGGIVTYPNVSAIPGFPPVVCAQVTGAQVYTSTPACAVFPTLYQIGEVCTGFGFLASYLIYTNPGCTICRTSNIIASWAPPVFPSTLATLTFN